MVLEPLPRSLKKAIERLEAEPDRPWRLGDLAAAGGVSSRTLQKQFQRFLRCTFRPFLRELRFEQARRELLADCGRATVTEIATRCGFAHLGRFASEYHRRYGETPSSTQRKAKRTSTRSARSPLVLATSVERPTIAILPSRSARSPAAPTRSWTRLGWRYGVLIGSGSWRRTMRAIIFGAMSVRTADAVCVLRSACPML